MTKRNLPAATAPDIPNAQFDLAPKARAAWDRQVTAAADDDDVISVLDVIGYDWWSDGGITAKNVVSQLKAMDDRPATVLINSPGGDFFEGLAIYNALRQHPGEVTVKIIGIAASAASIIAMAGDRIEIAKAGMMMIHNTQWVAVGDRHVMTETADAMAEFDATLASLYVDRSGNGKEEVQGWMDAETYMSGEKAVERGFADALLPGDATARSSARAETPFAYRLEAMLAHHGVPRAERRKAIREFTESMPGAASGDAKPGAGDDAADGGTSLSLALARLKLARA